MTAARDLLRRSGRDVDRETLAAQTASLGTMPTGTADEVTLATYDIVDGRPGNRFVPDRSRSASVRSVFAQGRSAVAFTLVAAAAGLVPAVGVPLLLRLFVDRYLVAGDEGWAAPVLVGLAAAAAVSAAVVVLQYAVLRRFVLRLSRTGMLGFTWHVLTLPPPTVARFGAGDLVARINAGQRLAFQGGMLLPLALVNVLNAVVFAVALVTLSAPIGLTAFFVAACSVASSLGILRWRRNLQQASDQDLVALTSLTSDVVAAEESVKAAAWEQFAFRRWSRARMTNARSLSRLGNATQLLALVPVLTASLGLGAVLATGCLLVMRGDITIGTVVAAEAFAVMLFEALAMLVFGGVLFQSVVSAQSQTDAVLREPQDPELVAIGDNTWPERLDGTVSVSSVTFGYDRDRPPLLDGLSLDIPAGSRLAVVGSSGSGKTTVARLVIGELRPWHGDILLDGTPRLLVPRDRRTADVAYVPQTSLLFPGTIRDNLTLWDDAVTEEQLRIAASDACIEQAVISRPGGFHALVSGGESGFSGGELQRLAIARALVRDPRILVLDEATSALDPLVEAEVEQNLRRRGCTCLVIAHRLSSIRDADQIVVLDGGRVVQRGTYAELRTSGTFAELLHG